MRRRHRGDRRPLPPARAPGREPLSERGRRDRRAPPLPWSRSEPGASGVSGVPGRGRAAGAVRAREIAPGAAEPRLRPQDPRGLGRRVREPAGPRALSADRPGRAGGPGPAFAFLKGCSGQCGPELVGAPGKGSRRAPTPHRPGAGLDASKWGGAALALPGRGRRAAGLGLLSVGGHSHVLPTVCHAFEGPSVCKCPSVLCPASPAVFVPGSPADCATRFRAASALPTAPAWVAALAALGPCCVRAWPGPRLAAA